MSLSSSRLIQLKDKIEQVSDHVAGIDKNLSQEVSLIGAKVNKLEDEVDSVFEQVRIHEERLSMLILKLRNETK